MTLDTDHEVTIGVGQDSLRLRNMDGKLQIRVRGIWGGSREGDYIAYYLSISML